MSIFVVMVVMGGSVVCHGAEEEQDPFSKGYSLQYLEVPVVPPMKDMVKYLEYAPQVYENGMKAHKMVTEVMAKATASSSSAQALALALSTASSSSAVVEPLMSQEEAQSVASEFMMGFALGLESKIGNTAECFSDAPAFVKDLKGFFADLEAAVKSSEAAKGFDLDAFVKALSDLGPLMSSWKSTSSVCGLDLLKGDVENLLKNPVGAILGAIMKIDTNENSIAADITKAVGMFKAKQYTPAGVTVGQLIGSLLK